MIKIFFSIILSLISAILINRIVSQNKIITINSVFPGCFFFLMSLPLILCEQKIETTVIVLLFIYLTYEIFKLKDLKVQKTTFFNIGFTSSIIGIFNIELLLNIILVLFSLIYYKQFNRKTAIVCITGLVCPVIIIFTINYLGSDLNLIIYNRIEYHATLQIIKNHITFWIIIAATLILSANELYNNHHKKKDGAKKGLNTLLFGSTTLIMCMLLKQSINLIFLLIIPLSVIIPNYILYTKHKVFRTFLLGLLTTILIINILYL